MNLVCIQEHNLDPTLHELYMRYASECHMHLIIGYSKTTAHRGGTLIISDEKTIPHVVDIHTEASMVVARYSFNGKNMDIASVYAPSDPTKRLDFFSHMNQHLTRYTLVGGDWNCVPDVTTDVKGKNALNYKNYGAALLGKKMAEKGLSDYRRQQLGDKFERTRKPWEKDTMKVMTRLDRWYIPCHEKFEKFLWDINVRPDLVWQAVPGDHLPVILTVEPMKGERGHQRPVQVLDIVKTTRELCFLTDFF